MTNSNNPKGEKKSIDDIKRSLIEFIENGGLRELTQKFKSQQNKGEEFADDVMSDGTPQDVLALRLIMLKQAMFELVQEGATDHITHMAEAMLNVIDQTNDEEPTNHERMAHIVPLLDVLGERIATIAKERGIDRSGLVDYISNEIYIAMMRNGCTFFDEEVEWYL